MSIYRIGKWNKGNNKRRVYLYSDADHKDRMGNCDWLPEDGDLCVCIEPAGDCFDNYVAMRKQTDGSFTKVGRFGAYAFGESCGELQERDFHLLQAGEKISFAA